MFRIFVSVERERTMWSAPFVNRANALRELYLSRRMFGPSGWAFTLEVV